MERYLGAFIVLTVSVTTWYFTASYKDAVWKEKFVDYQAALEKEYNRNINKVLEEERRAREQAQEIEIQYLQSVEEATNLRRDNDRLSAELGGLRDPYAKKPSVGVSTSSPSGCPVGCSSEGRLSEEATRFLLDLAEEADRVTIYANSCYAFVNGAR